MEVSLEIWLAAKSCSTQIMRDPKYISIIEKTLLASCQCINVDWDSDPYHDFLLAVEGSCIALHNGAHTKGGVPRDLWNGYVLYIHHGVSHFACTYILNGNAHDTTFHESDS